MAKPNNDETPAGCGCLLLLRRLGRRIRKRLRRFRRRPVKVKVEVKEEKVKPSDSEVEIREQMDILLQGVIQSTLPEKTQTQLLNTIAERGKDAHTVQTIKNVFNLMVDWYLNGQCNRAARYGLLILKAWAKHNLNTYEQFFDKMYLADLLRNKYVRYESVPLLIRESFDMLQQSEILYSHMKVIEKTAVEYVSEHPSVSCCSNFVELLLEYRDCVPKGNSSSSLCTGLIRSVALSDQPQDKLMEYVSSSETVFRFISGIWVQGGPDFIMESLQVVFEVISDPKVGPAHCLGAVVQHIPQEMLEVVVRFAVIESHIDDEQMITALSKIIGWITWPSAKNVGLWIVKFFQSLAAQKRYSILITVTETKICQVFGILLIPHFRDVCMTVLSHMLLGFQHSPEPFHKILPSVPRVIKELVKENSESSKDCSVKLVHLIQCCTYHYAGVPDLYKPVLELVQDVPQLSTCEIKKNLAENRWTRPQNLAVSERLTTIKLTGLFNLRNTCFLNSVIQVLYMSDGFRRSILALQIVSTMTVTQSLQHLFAVLGHTQRPAFAPMNFLRVSRPPWFQQGQQQDTSEFLKYLLDQIHEEQNSDNSSKEVSSIVEEHFSGQITYTYTCLTCRHKSARNEPFTDIPLAFPEYGSGQKSLIGGDNKTGRGDIHGKNAICPIETELDLNYMLENFLKPEYLHGDNKYFCDGCNDYQVCIKKSRMIKSPSNLVFTIMRFSFDLKSQGRVKILKNVKFQRTLIVPKVVEEVSMETDSGDTTSIDGNDPVGQENISSSSSTSIVANESIEIYALYGIVIHAGATADSGHYYSYTRNSTLLRDNFTASMLNIDMINEDTDLLRNEWYKFNDSIIEQTTYERLIDVLQNQSMDTPYLLFYKKIIAGQDGNIGDNKDLIPMEEPPLNYELVNVITKDIRQYLQEQEMARGKKKGTSHTSPIKKKDWYKDDEEDGPSGGCGGGDRGTSFETVNTSANRFIF